MTKKTWIAVVLAVLVGLPLLGVLTARGGLSQMASRESVRMGGAAPMMDKTVSSDTTMVYPASGVAEGRPEIMPYPNPGDQGFVATDERTIVKNAFLNLLVSDTRDTVTKIQEAAKATQGLVTSSNIAEDSLGKHLSASMTVRVPVDQLDGFLDKVRGLAIKVISENVTASDQTELRVDLETQITNLKATEAQLRTIMQRAATVEETLQVQSELTTVRGQIERLQGQLDNLQGAAQMSTVNLQISTKPSDLPVDGRNLSFWEEVSLTARQTWVFYRELFIGGVKTVIFLLPAFVLAGIVYLVWRKSRR